MVGRVFSSWITIPNPIKHNPIIIKKPLRDKTVLAIMLPRPTPIETLLTVLSIETFSGVIILRYTVIILTGSLKKSLVLHMLMRSFIERITSTGSLRSPVCISSNGELERTRGNSGNGTLEVSSPLNTRTMFVSGAVLSILLPFWFYGIFSVFGQPLSYTNRPLWCQIEANLTLAYNSDWCFCLLYSRSFVG